MDLRKDWSKIKILFSKSFQSSLHVSIASVNEQNMPTVTPIGTLFLNDDTTGFYFEKYASKLPVNVKTNKNICALGVISSKWLWIKALMSGQFKSHPAMKLYGTLGQKRKATNKEISRLNRRMKSTKGLKGNKYLWGKMEYIREIKFTKVEKMNLGSMTSDL